MERLTSAQHKAAEAMYAQTSETPPPEDPGPEAPGGGDAAAAGATEGEVIDAEVVEQRRGVVGHVLQRVGRRAGHSEERAGHPRQQRRPGVVFGQLAGQPDVAVVEADHPQTLVDHLLAELRAPEDHLRTQAHDQQHGRISRIAHVLVVDVDLARGCGAGAHLRHASGSVLVCSSVPLLSPAASS